MVIIYIQWLLSYQPLNPLRISISTYYICSTGTQIRFDWTTSISKRRLFREICSSHLSQQHPPNDFCRTNFLSPSSTESTFWYFSGFRFLATHRYLIEKFLLQKIFFTYMVIIYLQWLLSYQPLNPLRISISTYYICSTGTQMRFDWTTSILNRRLFRDICLPHLSQQHPRNDFYQKQTLSPSSTKSTFWYFSGFRILETQRYLIEKFL